MTQEFVPLAEVARRFGVHAETARRWMADGDLPAFKVGGL